LKERGPHELKITRGNISELVGVGKKKRRGRPDLLFGEGERKRGRLIEKIFYG